MGLLDSVLPLEAVQNWVDVSSQRLLCTTYESKLESGILHGPSPAACPWEHSPPTPECLFPTFPLPFPHPAIAEISQFNLLPSDCVGEGRPTHIQHNSLNSGTKVIYSTFVTLWGRCKGLELGQVCLWIAPCVLP